jgi:hypothetical protein
MTQQLDIALAEVSRAAEERHALTMECLALLTSLIRMMQSQDADLHVLVNHLRGLPTANGGRLQPQQQPIYGYPSPTTGAVPPSHYNGTDYLQEAAQQGISALDKLKTAMQRAANEPVATGSYDNGDYYGAGGAPPPPPPHVPPYRNGSN